MDIEMSSVIIGLCFLAVFFIPIMYSQRVQKAKNKKIYNLFMDAAKSHQLTISEYDVLDEHSVIGLDNHQNMLLFLRHANGGSERVLVDVSKIESCKMINLSRSPGKHITVVDRLGIRLTFKKGKIPEKQLLFYEGTHGEPLGNEYFLTKKWIRIIRQTCNIGNTSGKFSEKVSVGS
ncbi:MAG: hypothetical protein WD604_06070 [Balneolaceae bacterium]